MRAPVRAMSSNHWTAKEVPSSLFSSSPAPHTIGTSVTQTYLGWWVSHLRWVHPHSGYSMNNFLQKWVLKLKHCCGAVTGSLVSGTWWASFVWVTYLPSRTASSSVRRCWWRQFPQATVWLQWGVRAGNALRTVSSWLSARELWALILALFFSIDTLKVKERKKKKKKGQVSMGLDNRIELVLQPERIFRSFSFLRPLLLNSLCLLIFWCRKQEDFLKMHLSTMKTSRSRTWTFPALFWR